MKKSVKFKNTYFDMAGDLYLPEGMDENKKYQAVVCVHPGGGVKEQVANQRTLEANGAEPMYLTYVPSSEDEIDENTMVLLKEAYDYYRTPRAQHPNSTNKFLFRSVDKIIALTAFNQVDTLLSQPLLMIAGSDADTRGFSETAYEMANCEKELFLVEGATHIALYDVPEYVKQVTQKLVEFFSKNL